MLEIKNLKTYFYHDQQEVKAVDGLNLEVSSGEIVALVGESGCGKTVSALSITQILPPEAKILSGEIRFFNQDLLKLSQSQLQKIRGRDISYVFQEPATSLNPVFTIGEQIAEVLIFHSDLNKNQALKKAGQLLVQVGIPSPQERLFAYPHQLSGGMKQRAMIAMAIAVQPKLLIADEPTTALDVTIQAQILDLLLKLREEIGLSILMITHDLSILAEFADRVYVMYAGKIVESGPVESVYQRPAHAYTQALLRCIPDREGEKSS